MRNQTLAVFVGATLACVLGAPVAGAQPPGLEGMGPGKGPDGKPGVARVEAMGRFLGLSEPQQAQVLAILEQQRPQHEALRQALEANRDALRELLDSGGADATAVGEIVLEGHRIQKQGRALRDAQDRALRALLTADQQIRFDALKAVQDEGGPRSGARRGPGPRPGADERRRQ
jgi:Spy/CpxP family protein refolding chaperone